MAKPTDLPRWAETSGGTPASNIIEPSSGKKDTGYVTIAESAGGKGDVPTSGGLNWWMRLAYKWIEHLDDFVAADGTIDWSALGAVGAILKSAVADGASAVGLISDTVNALTTVGAKLRSWKNAGVEKAYLDKDGRLVPAGLDLLGSALQSILKGGTGGLDIGTSIASDLRILLNNVAKWTFQASDGALIGKHIECTADVTDENGIEGNGNGTGRGIVGVGGETAGAGSSAAGIVGNGGSNGGIGVYGQGVGGSSGVYGYGGTTGVGVAGYAGGGNANGIYGQGYGTGAGVSSLGGASGPGGAFAAGGSGVRGAINMLPQAAPSSPSNGDMWVETGTNTLKVRINGVTKTVTLT
jgi:hypothetical protein